MVFKCCVDGCKERSGLHSFPANKEIQNKWVEKTKTFHLNEVLKSKGKTIDHSHYKVCDKHFSENDFETNENGLKRLHRNTIPSVALPEKEPNNLLISEIPKEPSPSKNSGRTCVVLDFNSNLQEEVCITNKAGKTTNKNTKQTRFIANLNCRLKRAQGQNNRNKLNNKNVLNYLANKMSKEMLELVKMQVENYHRSLHTRSYSFYQKSFALAMYKQSPKHYRWFSRSAILPSKRTIQRHSVELVFESGIDLKMFDFIAQEVKILADIDRHCILSWNEVALKGHLDYSQSRDVIDGFVELLNERRPEFATHALVFMVSGISKAYKQPVAYFYTSGMNARELSEHIDAVTGATLKTGLTILGSVCDQIATNASAVHMLMDPNFPKTTSDGQLLTYEIHGVKIIHLFDAPHLIKVVRNNLYAKNLRHSVSNRWNVDDPINIPEQQLKLATWDHVSKLYEIDSRGNHRMLRKITEEHINPNKLKMRVSVATQIFSETYGKAMLEFSEKKLLPDNFSDTALILLFFNDLFDSINGSGSPQAKTLKGSVNVSSDHFKFWDYALKMLSEMDFIDKATGKVNSRSTVLKKFESTIRGHIELTKICMNLGINEVSLRFMNQDGLENAFGRLKALCHIADGKPTSTQLRTSYVTLILNNLSGAHSKNSNCEEDFTTSLIKDIEKLIENYNECPNDNNENKTETNEDEFLETIIFEPEFSEAELTVIEGEAITNVCNTVVKKLLPKTNCEKCQNILTFPSATLKQDFKNLFCAVNEIILHLCSENCLRKKIFSHLQHIFSDEMGCPEHKNEITLKAKEYVVTYALSLYCQNVNNLLSGKNDVPPSNVDHIQHLAYEFRQKKKRIGKYSDKFSL